LTELLREHKDIKLDGIDVESAQYELVEHLILKTDDEHGFYLHRLAALHVAQHTLYE